MKKLTRKSTAFLTLLILVIASYIGWLVSVYVRDRVWPDVIAMLVMAATILGGLAAWYWVRPMSLRSGLKHLKSYRAEAEELSPPAFKTPPSLPSVVHNHHHNDLWIALGGLLVGTILARLGAVRDRGERQRLERGGVSVVAARTCCTWPLRPEAKLRRALPARQHTWPAAECPCVSAGVHRCRWRLSLSSSLGRSRAVRERLLSPTRFPSLHIRVRRGSRGSAIWANRSEWCSPNGSGRRRMTTNETAHDYLGCEGCPSVPLTGYEDRHRRGGTRARPRRRTHRYGELAWCDAG